MDDAEVYRKHADELTRFAAALAGPSGAEDVVAAAVIRALAAPRWRSVDNKRAYLYRVVFNEAHRIRRDTIRRLGREQQTAPREAHDDERIDVDLRRALAVLSVRERAVVFLRYWADLAPGEIAELLETSLRTVERELSSARRKLGEMLS